MRTTLYDDLDRTCETFVVTWELERAELSSWTGGGQIEHRSLDLFSVQILEKEDASKMNTLLGIDLFYWGLVFRRQISVASDAIETEDDELTHYLLFELHSGEICRLKWALVIAWHFSDYTERRKFNIGVT